MSLNQFYDHRGKNAGLQIGCISLQTTSMQVDGYIFISSVNDFNDPVGGIITLEAFKTYFINGDVDLLGNRLVGQERCVILGTSSENSLLTSTGLADGIPLFTTNWATPVRHVTFRDVHTCLDIDGAPSADPNDAFDWTGVNFRNVTNVGEIKNIDNFIFTVGAFLNSQNMVFGGTVGTISMSNSLFVGDGSILGDIINISPAAIITRRFRITYSSFVAFGQTTAINVNTAATIPTESYILDTLNFSGNGTYQSGVNAENNKSLFSRNVGITNTAVNGQLYMKNNAIVTTISNINDYYKIDGSTTASADNARYTATDNRLTNNSIISRKYLIHADLSFNTTANNICYFGFYDSKLAAVREPSKISSTSNSGGISENVTMSCVVEHSQGDYIEVYARNSTGANDITVTDLNLIITQI